MDQNFEIAILFSIVENYNNYVFGDDLLPHSPRVGAASYKPWPVLAMWDDLSLEGYVMEEEKFNEKGTGFSSITIEKKMKK